VGDCHHVPGAGWDLAVAAGALVRLAGLVGLHEAQVDVLTGFACTGVGCHGQPKNAQSTRAAHTTSAAPTNRASATGLERWGLKGFMPMGASMLPPMAPRHLGTRGGCVTQRPGQQRLLASALVALAVVLGACAQGEAPEVPEGADGTQDPVLVEGRDVWSSQCARCHGASGGGGSGPKLSDGRAGELYPEVDDMKSVIAEGRNAMPAFGGSLTPEEIDAVTRYVLEVL
jgi:mono/diheme cytochrome c family protein